MAHPHVRISTEGSSDHSSSVGLTPYGRIIDERRGIGKRKRKAKRKRDKKREIKQQEKEKKRGVE